MTAIVLALWLAASASQAPADFSGQWTAEPGAATGTGNMGSGWAPAITITQNGTTLVVEETLFSRYDGQPPFRTTYAQACYLPDYPALGDSGFPSDP